jgi:hypothetical protein
MYECLKEGIGHVDLAPDFAFSTVGQDIVDAW